MKEGLSYTNYILRSGKPISVGEFNPSDRIKSRYAKKVDTKYYGFVNISSNIDPMTGEIVEIKYEQLGPTIGSLTTNYGIFYAMEDWKRASYFLEGIIQNMTLNIYKKHCK